MLGPLQNHQSQSFMLAALNFMAIKTGANVLHQSASPLLHGPRLLLLKKEAFLFLTQLDKLVAQWNIFFPMQADTDLME
jgi:hypothetical protein